ncbi:MAG: hypothetical protein IJY89_04910 [Clostridia bacterium]|nr:hypothetical protein [Clostridia bacterium]
MKQNKSGAGKAVKVKRSGNWLKNSLLLRLMVFFGALQEKVADSFFITRLQNAGGALFRRFEVRERFTRPFRIAFSREMEQSAILYWIDRLCDSFLHASLRSYGTFFISFAVYYLAISLVKGYLGGEELLSISIIAKGGVTLLLPLPLLFAQKDTTLAKGLLQSRIFSYLLFDLLGLERLPFEKEHKPTSGFLGGFLGGIAVAVLSAFVPVSTIVWIALTALFIRLCYLSPEAGMLTTLLCMPFFRGGKTGTMLLVVAFFFLVKLLRGKRNLKAGFYTGAMVAYLPVLLFCGLVSAFDGGFERCGKLLTLSTAFFLPALLFYRRAWIERTAKVMVLSGGTAVLWALFVYGTEYIPQRYLQFVPFVESLQGRFLAFSSFGAFAVTLLPVLAIHASAEKRSKARFSLVLTVLLLALTAVLSRDPGVWICCLLVLALLCIFRNRNTLFPLLLGGIGLGAAYLFLAPDWMENAIRRFSNGFSVDATVAKEQIVESFGRFFAGTGIGGGKEAGSFYTNMLAEQGLAGLLLLMLLLFGILSYGIYAYYKNDKVSPLQKKRLGGFAIGLAGLLALGLFTNLWQDEKMLFLLFFLAGVIVACGKVLCDEGAQELRVSEIDRDYLYIPVRTKQKKVKKGKKDAQNDAQAPADLQGQSDKAPEPLTAEAPLSDGGAEDAQSAQEEEQT